MIVAPSPLKQEQPAQSRPETPGKSQLPLPALINHALSYMQAGNTQGALDILSAAPDEARGNAFACRAFSLIYLSANDFAHAIEWFDHALRLNEKNAEALSGKGIALQGLGQPAEAVSCFDQALALRAADPETWYNRGVALDALGDVEAALHSYDAALAHRANYSSALTRRSAALAKLGRFEDALSAANAVIALATEDRADAWCLRGNMLQELGRYSDAIAAYNQTLKLRSFYLPALINRATAYKEVGQTDHALRDLDAALELEPQQPDALIARANLLQTAGRNADAIADYKRALVLRPLITHSPVVKVPDFRALFIFAPVAGNTPIDDMISFSTYESNILMLLRGIEYDVDFLRSKADVVVNLVSDADVSIEALSDASSLVDRLGKPVVNPPAKILFTQRDHISRLLEDVEGCAVPRTSRYSKDALLAALSNHSLNSSFPLIVRVAGTHGGEDMECLAGFDELEAFVHARNSGEFYVSEFIDYRSADGFFRKYRFIFVGSEILPYHLAIDHKWKVHHASTDMASHLWMQEEEKAFLARPEVMFSESAFAALRSICTKLNLDYFGIDCALDRDGKVVVFEVNASMLVHLRNHEFPYKNPAVLRIKAAFASMLRERAAQQRTVSSSSQRC
jgi:tetratricopeptide (TPR) repeat protein/glutathione synthase/RimK-type ligase-like ATP-grasp enzyme